MKNLKVSLSASLLFVLCIAQAQNPWAKYGYIPPKALTLSNGQYEEFFTNDTVVQIGSVMFNTVTNKVVAFLQTDTVYSEATLKPEIISRFLSPDPLEKQYPYYTPYQFAGNEPIKFVDLDGKEPGYLDPKSGNIIPASSSILHTPPSNAQYFNQTIDPVVVQNYAQLAAVLTSTFMSPVLSQTVKTVIGFIRTISKEETPTPAPKLNNGNAQTTETAATSTGKSVNKLKPSEEATGAHTSFKTDPKTGKITNYVEYEQNPKNPSGFQEVKRVDLTGKSHGGVPTPHVKVAGQKQVRPATPEELPKPR